MRPESGSSWNDAVMQEEFLELLGSYERRDVEFKEARRDLQPLLDAGILRMTNPENPRASNQRYVLTEAGAEIRARRLPRKDAGDP